MASSGTVGQTQVPVDYIFDTAARRCGVSPANLTPESVELLKNTLYTMLSDWSNRGVNLWRLQQPLLGLQAGKYVYDLPVGTIDILNANFRTPQRLSSTPTSSAGGTADNATDGDVETIMTQVSTLGNLQFVLEDAQYVNLVGILPGASSTLALVIEYSTDSGVTWNTAKTIASAAYIDREWAWFEIDPSYEADYWRIRATSGTLVLREAYLCKDWYDVPMYRMNKDEYSMLPNKRFQASQIYQFWLNRQIDAQMVLWPTPSSYFYLLALQTHRHIEDVGAMTNTVNIPQRWIDALCWCLAFKALPELPGADMTRFDMLAKMAVEPRFDAEAEERDKSPVIFTPNIRGYTRG